MKSFNITLNFVGYIVQEKLASSPDGNYRDLCLLYVGMNGIFVIFFFFVDGSQMAAVDQYTILVKINGACIVEIYP